MTKDIIKIEVDDSYLNTLFTRLGQKMTDMTPVMRTIGDIVRASVIRNFEVGGRYSEVGSWRGGSKTWAQRKKPRNQLILVKERILMGSINYWAFPRKVEIGTPVGYGIVHQKGFQGTVSVPAHSRKVKSRDVKEKFEGKKRIVAKGIGFVRAHSRTMNIPARPFLVVQDVDMDEIQKVVLNYITDRNI